MGIGCRESGGTIEKRFFDRGRLTEENRGLSRTSLYHPRMENSISVILFDETTKQESADGIRFVELLAQRVRPGIKTDRD